MSKLGYLLDTNIIIDLLDGKREADSFYQVCRENNESIYFSVISVTETLTGDVIKRGQIFKGNGLYDVDYDIADKAAEIRRIMRNNGQSILKTPDSLILSTALIYEHTLVTNDDRLIWSAELNGVAAKKLYS